MKNLTTNYTTTEIKVKNTLYKVTVATGKFNYVSVRKVTANPYGMLGTEFKNFDEAVSHYKNPTLKVELLKLELGM
jgi:hypothetical protein